MHTHSYPPHMQAGPPEQHLRTRQAMAAVVTDVTINFTVNMVTVVTMVTMFSCCG